MRTVIPLIIALFVGLSCTGTTITDTLPLPFEENFSSGLFETNGWIDEGDNWQIAGQSGNAAPSAEFRFSPYITDYSLSLTSAAFDATGFIAGEIFIDFDLKLTDNQANNMEKLAVEVYDGNQWTEVYSDSSHGSFNWSKKHIEITDQARGLIFQIRFRAWGSNSMNIVSWGLDNIYIYRLCKPPYDAVSSFPQPTTHGCWVLVEWESPCIPQATSDWLHWDNGNNYDAIGLTGGGTFLVSARFTPSQLQQYAGGYLSRIRLFYYQEGGSITLKVWTGENAAQLVLSQPVISYMAGQWNEFILNTPVLLTGNSELWFGYEVTHEANQYIAGVDNGPAEAGFGDLISLDGVTWQSMSQVYDLNYNWNLGGFITPQIHSDSCLVTGYNVYREGEWLATTTETNYLDTYNESRNVTMCYSITALYEDCESGFSNLACEIVSDNCFVDVNDINLQTIDIYPNPASRKVTFSLTQEIEQVIIYDILGKELEVCRVNPANLVVGKDISQYRNGIYLVMFISSNGKSTSRKLIVNQ